MIWILFAFSFSTVKVSDIDVRLPIYCEKEGVRPYKLVTFHSPDVEFQPENGDLIDVEVVSRDSSSTVINISVKYSDNQPITTNIRANFMDEGTSNFPVYIDLIHHISIIPSSDSMCVYHLSPIQVRAFNSKGDAFSSLSGIQIEWSTNTPDEPFTLFLPDDPALKTFYKEIPSNYVIIKGEKNSYANLTCKLTNQAVKEATYPLKFNSPVIFYPEELYITQRAEVVLNLFYGRLDDNLVEPIKLVNMTTEGDFYTFESDSPSVVEVLETGKVATHDFGTATITATDKRGLAKPAKTVLHVIYPDSYKWDEQWIKPSEEPDISNITIYYQNNVVTFSTNCPISLLKSWENIGTNIVNGTFRSINYTVHGVVHTCPQPLIDRRQINVYLDGAKYQFKIMGGSGYFDFEYDSSLIKIENDNQDKIVERENGYVLSSYSISAIKEGKGVIKIIDQKINDYTLELEFDSLKSSDL